jgi:hypothetical protein
VGAATDGNLYLVKPVESVPVGSGPASLLWHRHSGRAVAQLSELSAQLSELLVIGTVSIGVEELVFTSERLFSRRFTLTTVG